jgi:FkbM family methyltransferase
VFFRNRLEYILIDKINDFLTRYFGIRVSRARPTFDLARSSLLRRASATLVVDGGANRGQWAQAIRKEFHNLSILSVEPISSAFEVLASHAAKDSSWKCINVALSDQMGRATMNVASNGQQSSSLLNPKNHLEYYPSVDFPETQETQVVTLDSLDISNNEHVYLKLDLQGHELPALKGARKLLHQVVGIELEMTTVEMYEGQATFLEVASYLESLGFKVYSLSDPFRGQDGQTIYLDVLFARGGE